MRNLLKAYVNDSRGNFAMMGALFTGALLLLTGATIETSRMISMKSELQNMADSAALVGAYSARANMDNREDRVRKNIQFNQANISETQVSANAIISFDDNLEEVTVEIPNSFPSFFGGILGMDTLDVSAKSIASYKTEAVDPVSIAFALDVSGSMSSPVGSGAAKIDVLKQSIKLLFDELEAGTPNPELLPDSIRTSMSAYNTALVETQPMSWGWTHLEAAVDSLSTGGGTNSTPALESAYDQIKNDRVFRAQDPKFNSASHREYVIFMTDGDNNQIIWDEETAQECLNMRNDGIELFSIAFASPEKGEVLLLDCASWNDGVEKPDDPLLETYAEIDLNPNDKCAEPGANGLALGLENGNNGNGKALGHCEAKEAKEEEKSEYYFDAEDAATFKQAFARIGAEIANLTIRTKS